MSNAAPAKIHPFEKAGLGIAPFRVVGCDHRVYQAIPGDPSCPLQPGASCDYCATGIYDCYTIKSADGRTFVVGSDCVARTVQESAGTDAEKAARKLHEQVLRLKRQATHAKQDERIAAIVARVEANREALAALPHSKAWLASKGATKLEEIEWLLKNAGRAGKLRIAKILDAAGVP